MPTIRTFTIANGCNPESNEDITVLESVTLKRVVQEIHDVSGTGQLEWTREGGLLPDNDDEYVEVYANGNRLSHTAEYTITKFNTSTTSLIQITYPSINMYYTVIAYYQQTVSNS